MSRPNLVSTRKRLLFIIIAIIFLFTALTGRLAYIQLYQGRDLQTRAAQQWYRDLPLGAPRGIIYDAAGNIWVDNKDVFTVYVRPRAVTDKPQTAKILSDILVLDEKRVLESISRIISEVTLARKVPEETAEKLRVLNLNGVYLTPDTQRNYPQGASFSKVLGFTNIDNVGQNGIEGYYDKFLKGIDGFAFTNTDLTGRETDKTVTRFVPAIPGFNLTLSADKNIQAFADFAVLSAMQEWGAQGASMIVMDVTDGGIKAMSALPSFDLNAPPRHDIDLLNALSKNSMIVDVFEPGSTFKIFTTAAAIEHGLVSGRDTFYCRGSHLVDGQRIRCWRSIGHGSQTLEEGVKNSCNVVFMNLASRLGTDKLYDKLLDFGFNQKTNVDFYGESRGILLDRKIVKNIDLARIGFGQAVAVTPLQLITALGAAVNGGTLYEPYFVKTIEDFQGRRIFDRRPKAVRQAISPATSAQIKQLLENVVADGSGRKAQVAGYRIGGKTGTAQKYGTDGRIAQGKYVSSFIGFAPVENPKYAILMLVDEPAPGAYYGSLVAAPHVGDVFGRIFNYTGLLPSQPAEPVPTVTMPMLIGKTPQEAAAILTQMKLAFEIAGEEGIVESTLPIPDTVIPQNDVVLLRLSG
ncbi:MAG: penicillin-binding transpeptidase domain-containing protein [Firmicutes bacterium]|nr:penicillin-binding transpeptidase domain-containing protein [Bacillota bacterium]